MRGDFISFISFNTGDFTRNHTITINDDRKCENDPNEHFFSNLARYEAIGDINVTVPLATVTINNTAEPECGKQWLLVRVKV